jgi:hypothetical protein
MVLAYAVLFWVIVALLLRRDLSAIGRYPYRGGWKLVALLGCLFVLQAVLVLYAPGRSPLQMGIVMLPPLALILLVILNAHLPGAILFGLGVFFNMSVMAANGGWMPVTPETYQCVHPDRAVEVQARAPNSKGITLARSETELWVLSDVICVSLPWFRTAMSIGDMLLILAAARFIFQATSRRAALAVPQLRSPGEPRGQPLPNPPAVSSPGFLSGLTPQPPLQRGVGESHRGEARGEGWLAQLLRLG